MAKLPLSCMNFIIPVSYDFSESWSCPDYNRHPICSQNLRFCRRFFSLVVCVFGRALLLSGLSDFSQALGQLRQPRWLLRARDSSLARYVPSALRSRVFDGLMAASLAGGLAGAARAAVVATVGRGRPSGGSYRVPKLWFLLGPCTFLFYGTACKTSSMHPPPCLERRVSIYLSIYLWYRSSATQCCAPDSRFVAGNELWGLLRVIIM